MVWETFCSYVEITDNDLKNGKELSNVLYIFSKAISRQIFGLEVGGLNFGLLRIHYNIFKTLKFDLFHLEVGYLRFCPSCLLTVELFATSLKEPDSQLWSSSLTDRSSIYQNFVMYSKFPFKKQVNDFCIANLELRPDVFSVQTAEFFFIFSLISMQPTKLINSVWKQTF